MAHGEKLITLGTVTYLGVVSIDELCASNGGYSHLFNASKYL